MKTLTLGTDFGPFATNGQCAIPFEDFITKLDCKFFIGQGGFAENIPGGYSTKINLQAARKAGVPIIGEYYWLDADDNPQAVIDAWSRDVDANNPDFCAYDLEQDRGASGALFTGAQIARLTVPVISGMRKRFPQKKHVVYSRTGLLATWKELLPFIAEEDSIWLAANPDYGLTTYEMSWADIKAGIMRRVTNYNIKPYPWELMNVHDDSAGPDLSLTPKAKNVFWQTGSRRKPQVALIPGIYNHPYDWTYWLGDFESLRAWAGLAPVVPPVTPVEKTLEQKVDIMWANYAGPGKL